MLKPQHPGVVLKNLYLDIIGENQAAFAERIGVSREIINKIINGKKPVSEEMAFRFAKALGTSPHVWVNMQLAWDESNGVYKDIQNPIKPYKRLRTAA